MTYTKEEVSKLLKESNCEVTFTKTDGSERIMKCSLCENVLKPYIKEAEERKQQMIAEGKEVKERPENPNVLSVIDLEKQSWRSFRIDSIKNIVKIKE